MAFPQVNRDSFQGKKLRGEGWTVVWAGGRRRTADILHQYLSGPPSDLDPYGRLNTQRVKISPPRFNGGGRPRSPLLSISLSTWP